MSGTIYDLPSVLSCNYGASSLSLLDFAVEVKSTIKDGMGKVGNDVTVTAECEIACTSDGTADFSSQIGAVIQDLRINGRDFAITGLGGAPLITLSAALCYEGAPWIDYKTEPAGPLKQKFSLRVFAKTFDPDPSKNNGNTNAFKIITAVDPAGLKTVTQEGEINGPTATVFFLQTVIKAFQAAFPDPGWVVRFQYTTTAEGVIGKLNYTTVAKQNFGPLPQGNTGAAVDGQMTRSTTRDEQMRLVTTINVDLLIIGDPIQIVTYIRTQVPAGQVIFKEQFSVGLVSEQRLQGSFTTLQSADMSPLLNWTESYRIERAKDTYELRTYPGTGPILAKNNSRISKITQSGSMIAVGVYAIEPDPTFPIFAEEPEVTYEDVNNVEKKTSWRYVSWYFGQPTGISPGQLGNGGNTSAAIPPNITPPLLSALSRGVQTIKYEGETA